MEKIHDYLILFDGYLGGGPWFVYLLLFTGLFFTLYLGFPQIRYFGHSLKVVSGKFDRKSDVGDTSHFQALTTALSGTVGTGNIAGVALAIHLGGPAALFWMLITGMLGMTTKFVEVTISHKYREMDSEGRVAGGPMYYMKKRLNFKIGNKVINTGKWMGAFFAAATILSSLGTGNMPQINSIASAMYSTFGVPHIVVGGVLSLLLAFVILGGIQRIAKVTSRLVPSMALIYILGAFAVLIFNYDNIIPSIISIFSDVFSGTAATGGFLGASVAYAFNRGVNRGLFSNESGQGSAPIAHAAARAHEPVSEGIVALLEPFIDTIVICTITGLVLLSSGIWKDKVSNDFQSADQVILADYFQEGNPEDMDQVFRFLDDQQTLPLYSGTLEVQEGKVNQLTNNEITLVHARSIAEDVMVTTQGEPFTGTLEVSNGRVADAGITFSGRSLIHSAPMTAAAFNRSFMGGYGEYIVAIGLLLFAFSTAISWSYYGDRSVTYLFGTKYVIHYRIAYVVAFFFAAFTDTTIIWALSYITIALMTVPNLIGILILRKEIKTSIREYWADFKSEQSGR
ncbi:MAG: sodium:alanine symporter family protein [Bacteroidales bacterium]